jgi:hypothetical protein
MREVLAILFPWQGTFKQLGLGERWWHRLAVVAFFIALLPALGGSGFLAFSYFQPHTRTLYIRYWTAVTAGNPVEVTLGPPVTQAQHDESAKEIRVNQCVSALKPK